MHSMAIEPKQANSNISIEYGNFGTTAAPYLAIKTLLKLAIDERQKFPEATQSMLNDFYVDDVLTGADSIDAETENPSDFNASNSGFQFTKMGK